MSNYIAMLCSNSYRKSIPLVTVQLFVISVEASNDSTEAELCIAFSSLCQDTRTTHTSRMSRILVCITQKPFCFL